MGMTGIAISKMRQSGGNTVAGAQMYENAWPEHIMSEEDFYPTNPKYQKYILPDVKPVPGANYGTTVEQRHGMYGNTQYKAGEVRYKPAQKESLTPQSQQSTAPREVVRTVPSAVTAPQIIYKQTVPQQSEPPKLPPRRRSATGRVIQDPIEGTQKKKKLTGRGRNKRTILTSPEGDLGAGAEIKKQTLGS